MGEDADMGQGVGGRGLFPGHEAFRLPRLQCVWILNALAGTLIPFLVSAKDREARPQNLPRPGPQVGLW